MVTGSGGEASSATVNGEGGNGSGESEGGGNNEATDEISGQTRYGRPVLSARLLAGTPFDVTRRAVQTNLWSSDASGKSVFARYNIPFPTEAEAKAFAALATGCRPA